jgi:Superfamily II DNA and RNA helicases
VHRIGRTGRAGMEGIAMTLFTEKERYKLDNLCAVQDQVLQYESIDTVPQVRNPQRLPDYITLYISGGRKDKVRRGDVLGAIVKEAGIDASQVGKIDVVEHSTYVAVERDAARQVVSALNQGKIKGRKFKVGRVE